MDFFEYNRATMSGSLATAGGSSGTATISPRFTYKTGLSVTGSTTLRVTTASLVAASISPLSTILNVGGTEQFNLRRALQ